MEIARKMGINAVILSTFMEGESCEAGTFMACLAREIQENRRPFRAALVCYFVRRDDDTD